MTERPEMFTREEIKEMVLEACLETMEIIPNGRTAEQMEEIVDAFVSGLERPRHPVELLLGVPNSKRINLRKCYAIAYRNAVLIDAILTNRAILDNWTLRKIAENCSDWTLFFSLVETGERQKRAQAELEGWAEVLRQVNYGNLIQKEASS
jgi:hypothetical protein